jgi:integrase
MHPTGSVRAAEITSVDLRRMIRELRAKGLSGSATRSCVSSASAIFRHGVRDLGVIDRNPVRDLDRGDLPSARRKTEPRYLSVREVELLLSQMTSHFRTVGAMCFWGGLRVSEALALRWGHIHFEQSRIDVPATKSVASASAVPMVPRLTEQLVAHQERAARLGLRFDSEALVFQTSHGFSPGRRNVYRAVARAAVKAGLVGEGRQPVGIHDLRHSLAAHALQGGLSIVETSRLLRHGSPHITAQTYAGLSDDAVASLGKKLENIGASPN